MNSLHAFDFPACHFQAAPHQSGVQEDHDLVQASFLLPYFPCLFCSFFLFVYSVSSHTHTQNPLLLRSKVFNLLSEVPGGRLQV